MADSAIFRAGKIAEFAIRLVGRQGNRRDSAWVGLALGLRLLRRVGFKTIGEIRAYQVARAFKLAVYNLVRSSPAAQGDLRYRSQLLEAAASVEMNIIEGFARYSAGEFAQFLRVARGSLHEATGRLQDGIDRGHFTPAACLPARELADEAGRLITGLIASLQRLLDARPNRQPLRPRKPRGQ